MVRPRALGRSTPERRRRAWCWTPRIDLRVRDLRRDCGRGLGILTSVFPSGGTSLRRTLVTLLGSSHQPPETRLTASPTTNRKPARYASPLISHPMAMTTDGTTQHHHG